MWKIIRIKGLQQQQEALSLSPHHTTHTQSQTLTHDVSRRGPSKPGYEGSSKKGFTSSLRLILSVRSRWEKIGFRLALGNCSAFQGCLSQRREIKTSGAEKWSEG